MKIYVENREKCALCLAGLIAGFIATNLSPFLAFVVVVMYGVISKTNLNQTARITDDIATSYLMPVAEGLFSVITPIPTRNALCGFY